MGTRGAYGFTHEGKDKISYNHYDSYPSELGCSILATATTRKIADLRNFAKSIKTVKENATPTAAQIKKLGNLGITIKPNEDWYGILREHQGNLESLISNKIPYMTDGASFLKDSLFCEFAYVINLDSEMLEFYVGFNKTPITEGRFAGAKPKDGYYPVRLIKQYPLAEIYGADVDTLVQEMNELARSTKE